MTALKPVIDWTLPDGWELVQPAKLVPIAGVNNGWLALYRRAGKHREEFLSVLIGEYSGQIISWCHTP